MHIEIKHCKNCGIEYRFQESGYDADLYNDHEYCPECKEAITLALNKIPRKTIVKYMVTHLVTLEQLEQFEVDNKNDYIKNMNIRNYAYWNYFVILEFKLSSYEFAEFQ